MYPRPSKSYEREYETEQEGFLDDIWNWFTDDSTVEIISRSEWGARQPKAVQTLRLPVRYAYIHHTAGSSPNTMEKEHQLMRVIQNDHMNSRGFADIGYNFVIMPSGRIFEGRGWNRVGAATKKWNSQSLSFCWAGNYENNRPTSESIEAGRRLLAHAIESGYLTSDFVIRGHRDAAKTACPGRYLYEQFNALDPRR